MIVQLPLPNHMKRVHDSTIGSFIILRQSHLRPLTCMLQPLMAHNSNYRYGRSNSHSHGHLPLAAHGRHETKSAALARERCRFLKCGPFPQSSVRIVAGLGIFSCMITSFIIRDRLRRIQNFYNFASFKLQSDKFRFPTPRVTCVADKPLCSG